MPSPPSANGRHTELQDHGSVWRDSRTMAPGSSTANGVTYHFMRQFSSSFEDHGSASPLTCA